MPQINPSPQENWHNIAKGIYKGFFSIFLLSISLIKLYKNKIIKKIFTARTPKIEMVIN